ncbi:hypothetical protein O181_019627 [Austropuccinia psidii MF-1]|uniref:Uncharacterized protein n=1 Tax=Austropuccinia psidii MF-1 TaxID=1389203 RepID=A0A9Q3CBX6_9BASI|nr:hypothetical protein [Austropuccinia psidii MF-1]
MFASLERVKTCPEIPIGFRDSAQWLQSLPKHELLPASSRRLSPQVAPIVNSPLTRRGTLCFTLRKLHYVESNQRGFLDLASHCLMHTKMYVTKRKTSQLTPNDVNHYEK